MSDILKYVLDRNIIFQNDKLKLLQLFNEMERIRDEMKMKCDKYSEDILQLEKEKESIGQQIDNPHPIIYPVGTENQIKKTPSFHIPSEILPSRISSIHPSMKLSSLTSKLRPLPETPVTRPIPETPVTSELTPPPKIEVAPVPRPLPETPVTRPIPETPVTSESTPPPKIEIAPVPRPLPETPVTRPMPETPVTRSLPEAPVHRLLTEIPTTPLKIPHIELQQLPETPVSDPYKNIKGHIDTYSQFPDFSKRIAFKGDIDHIKTQLCVENLDKLDKLKGKSNFNIITFNVHNFVKKCNTPGRNLDHFISFINKVLKKTNIDVLNLQEVVPIYNSKPTMDSEIESGKFDILVSKLKELGFDHYIITNAMWNPNEQRKQYYLLANCIFTKQKMFEKFEIGIYMNRAVQICKTIGPKGKYIYVLNTHIEPTNQNYIKKQVRELMEIINYFAKEGDPIIITGDFNHEIRKNKMFNDFVRENQIIAPGDEDNDITGFNQMKQIDYILGRNNSEFKVELSAVLKTDVSDHYPVFVSIAS